MGAAIQNARLILLWLTASFLAFAAANSQSIEKPSPSVVSGEQAVSTASGNEFKPPQNIAGQSAWLSLRYKDQETNLCVPTSASIILDYFGNEVSPRQIKELSMGREYSPDEPFNDFTITLFRDLISGLRRIGYSWKEKDYPDNLNGLRQGLAEIEHSLDDGMPVMIDTTRLNGHSSAVAGHTFVVAGYSVPQQSLYVVDPNIPAPGTRVVGFKELESIWNSRSVNFDKRAAVFPQGRKKD
jgi:hypothetical protein